MKCSVCGLEKQPLTITEDQVLCSACLSEPEIVTHFKAFMAEFPIWKTDEPQYGKRQLEVISTPKGPSIFKDFWEAQQREQNTVEADAVRYLLSSPEQEP